MNVDLSGLEARTTKQAQPKKFAPKAFKARKPTPDVSKPAAPAEATSREPAQPAQPAVIPEPAPSLARQQDERQEAIAAVQAPEPSLPPEADRERTRSLSPEQQAAASTLASMEMVPADAAPPVAEAAPQPGELNTRGKKGKYTGRGARRARAAKHMEKPDMGTASLKQIVAYATAQDRTKVAAERRRKAEALRAAQEAGEEGAEDADGTEAPTEGPKASAVSQRVAPVAFGVPQLVVNEETGEVEERMIEAPQGPAPMPVGRALDDGHLVNSSSYANRAPNDRWTGEDTELFYKAVQTFGIELSLIVQLFPGRSRKTIKAKFTKEERVNSQRMNEAIETARRQPPETLARVLSALVSKANERLAADEAAGEEPEPLDIPSLFPSTAEASPAPSDDRQLALTRRVPLRRVEVPRGGHRLAPGIAQGRSHPLRLMHQQR
ncbi:hypothetical protein WJX73_002127 [Symbiochloris irregularis]|uniref:Myb-like domain-containing protein n=1 Tax=Symbiochloris irregularis TaxID=706552 RepID=A0AAW1PVF7_9CHLO